MDYIRLKKYYTILTCIAAIMVAMSFKTPPAGKLIIHFENFVGDKKLALDTATYTNSLGQAYTITNFKYYISDITLRGPGPGDIKDGLYYRATGEEKSHLIRSDNDGIMTVETDFAPDGDFDEISFMVGVDSVHNCSGAQSDDLDPINGMFWTWSSGYIFMKLEGKSPASKSPGHIFEYHIGGYKEPTNFIRTVTLHFEKLPLHIKSGTTTHLYIKTDAAKILTGANQIDFSKLSSVTDFHNADKIADNYVGMFSIIRMGNGQ